MKLPEIWNLMLLFCSASANLYSSIVGLEKLVQIEHTIIQIYKSYVQRTEQHISELRRQIERLEKEHEKSTDYTRDPFNSFHLVSRILIKWNGLENYLSYSLLKEVRKNISELKSSRDFPTQADLEGTADAINLISDTYNIEIASLANGIMNGIQYPSQLSADDCLTLGEVFYKKKNFRSCYAWMDEAIKRYQKEGIPAYSYKIERSLDVKAYSAYLIGNLSKALNITIELLKYFPNNPKAKKNKKYYSYMLKSKGFDSNKAPEQQEIQKDLHSNEKRVYGGICRKEILPQVRVTSKLKCRYVHNDNPFLRLAPIKEEEVFLEPRIVIFKDVLYDSEIELLKKLASPKLKSALVVNPDGAGEFSKVRIGQMSWIEKNEHPTLRKILLRAEDMTKLDPSRTENLQVVNYGVGGHYEPHFDPLQNSEMTKESGDRIATLLFYMNDVDQGGATAFNKLNMGVWPQKGTAVLWYNLLSDDDKIDKRTMHGACPVVAGTKWVLTIWFRGRGQELRIPCKVKP